MLCTYGRFHFFATLFKRCLQIRDNMIKYMAVAVALAVAVRGAVAVPVAGLTDFF